MFNVLAVIIEYQRPLMDQFREIEARNGMTIVSIPCDMQSYEGQTEMRRLAWCIHEELCEACDAAMQANDFSNIVIHEELIDALHFLAEFLIVSGFENKPFRIFESNQRTTVGFLEVMIDLGMAINILKNKPWKQTMKEFDEVLFGLRFGKFLLSLAQLFFAVGLTDEKLLEIYKIKHELNRNRIASGV